MFKEFNVEFQDVEMIGGADNLLENTKVTKVVMSGDNKMSSLDSAFKNCSELDNIQGGLELNGVSDIDNILDGNNLIKSIDLKNVNNENISANNSFPNVEEINIGGELYNKKAIQNVIASKEWTFDNVNYVDTVGENVITHTSNITEEDENTQIVINDALEQKARDIEIKGQTFQNLIQGKEGAELLADIKFESIEGNPSELEPPIDHPVCVEVIEGQTYQNLIEGKGEYNLTDTYNATWTESNNSFEDIPDVVEIPEIWGNTVQDETDLSIIQSVGELYVDEEGSPILDEEGNEQYKLEIESSNVILHDEYKNLPQGKFFLKKGSYTFSWNISFGLVLARTRIYNRQGVYVNSLFELDNRRGTDRVTLEGTKNITVDEDGYYVEALGTEDSIGYITQREGYNADTSVNPQSNKTTILMPQPLRKVGEYSDKLYWDYNKNKFLMDIGTQIVKATTNPNYVLVKESDEFVTVSQHHNYLTGMEGTGSFCSLLSQIKSYNATEEGFCYVAPLFYFTLRKNKLDNSTVGYALAVRNWLVNNNATLICPKKSKTIETKILEKLSLETYSPITYISTDAEVQPSQMNITNKRNVFLPLGLQANKDYTLQLDSVGKDDKPITVNLGGSEVTTQPVNDTSTHHKVVIKTPSTLTSDKLELSGEGVQVNDVMLFEGGGDVIKQEVEYVEGIQSIGELQEDGTYKIDILSSNTKFNINNYEIVDESLNKGDVDIVPLYNGVKIKSKRTGIYQNGYVEITGLDPTKEYRLRMNVKNYKGSKSAVFIMHEKGKDYITQNGGCNTYYTTDYNINSVFTPVNGSIHIFMYIVESSAIGECDFTNINLTESSENYEGKMSTQSILLPQPLNKIGDVKDRLYWDEDKGYYCIEQNIGENLEVLNSSNIIDLPHLNKKYSLDTYLPTTCLECSNSPIQPSRMYFETDKLKYKPLALEADKSYTIQFNCEKVSEEKVKFNLGGSEEEIQAVVGTNHINITTPAELSSDRLYISGQGNKVSDVMLVDGDMKQSPEYFDGIESVGELQDDGSYKIDIKTNEDFTVSIKIDLPLGKNDKLYWNKENNRYEIDRNGTIEIPIVEGDIIDLPRLYQRDDTILTVDTGNIKPSEIKIKYKDLN